MTTSLSHISAPQHEDLRKQPISQYSLAKVANTQFLQMLYRTEKFPATTLRLFFTYGPGKDKERFFPQIINGCLEDSEFPTSAGEQLRDFCYMGATVDASRFLPQIIRGCLDNTKFPTSAGEQYRDFCYIEDTIRAFLKALVEPEVEGEVFNVASGKPVSIR